MTYVRVPVPRLTAGLLSNVLGLLGLVALVIAPGGLAGNWWWSVLAGGVALVAVSYLVSAQAAEVDAALDPEQRATRWLRAAP